jgi:chromosome segregation ATPase
MQRPDLSIDKIKRLLPALRASEPFLVAALEALLPYVEHLEQKLLERADQIDKLEAELAAARGEIVEINCDGDQIVTGFELDLKVARALLAAADERLEKTQDELRAVRGELGAVRAELEVKEAELYSAKRLLSVYRKQN